MPFNPSDPRGSIAGLLANRDPSITARGPGSAIDPMTPMGSAGPSPGTMAASPFNDPARVGALNAMSGGSPLPMPATPAMPTRSGLPGNPYTPFGQGAGPSGPNPLSGPRGAELQALAAGVPGNPAFAGTGGNSPGVTVTPGITPSNYVDYFGTPPTSAADAPMAGMYPQYTSVADPSGNTSWQGNMAATGIPFNPANSPGNPPDFGMGGPNPIGIDPLAPKGLV